MANRSDIISEYVRYRIREWKDSGKDLQDLAATAGMTKSSPSTVLAGTGVGPKNGPKYARVFGFGSYDDMQVAAVEWWQNQPKQSPQSADDSLVASAGRDDAVQAVRAFSKDPPHKIQAILEAYNHPRFANRDRDWWVQTILAELARDRANDVVRSPLSATTESGPRKKTSVTPPTLRARSKAVV